jgi:hypothetical protein
MHGAPPLGALAFGNRKIVPFIQVCQLERPNVMCRCLVCVCVCVCVCVYVCVCMCGCVYVESRKNISLSPSCLARVLTNT